VPAGIRPIPNDGFSAVGWTPGFDGLYVVVTHSGVTLAPILAELAASEVHGSSEELLAPFRPDRFTAWPRLPGGQAVARTRSVSYVPADTILISPYLM